MRLQDTHPTKEKFDKLCAYADELGLHISFNQGYVRLVDKDFPHDIEVADLEISHMVCSFPPDCEVKLVYEIE